MYVAEYHLEFLISFWPNKQIYWFFIVCGPDVYIILQWEVFMSVMYTKQDHLIDSSKYMNEDVKLQMLLLQMAKRVNICSKSLTDNIKRFIDKGEDFDTHE